MAASPAPIVRTLLNVVTYHDLFRANARVLGYCRGDAAGAALLYALSELGSACGFPVRLMALHVVEPFSAEPALGDAGAALAKEVAASCRCPASFERLEALDSAEGDTPDRRKALLVRTARELGAEVVALPDCADDLAEAVLAAILAGVTAPRDLAGPPLVESSVDTPRVRLVRPFQRTSRGEIHRYLRARGIDPASLPPPPADSDLLHRVRTELLPLLQRDYNPRVREALLHLADSARGSRSEGC